MVLSDLEKRRKLKDLKETNPKPPPPVSSSFSQTQYVRTHYSRSLKLPNLRDAGAAKSSLASRFIPGETPEPQERLGLWRRTGSEAWFRAARAPVGRNLRAQVTAGALSPPRRPSPPADPGA